MIAVVRLAETVAGSAGALSRRLRLGGGTSIVGMVLNRLDPGAMERLAAETARRCVVLSGTNGKTTTARMLIACLAADGRSIAANTAGANLASGISAALLAAKRAGRRKDRNTGQETGRTGESVGVFEVDEAALNDIVRRLRPGLVLLMNLFRDQLDRYGELESVTERWVELAGSLPEDVTLLLNADDPALAFLGNGHPNTVLFGMADDHGNNRELSHAADTIRCRRCGEALSHDFVTVGHLGAWRCDSCGLHRPTPRFQASRVELRGFEGLSFSLLDSSGGRPEAFDVSVPIGGLPNAYNALAAASAARALGVPPETVSGALSQVDAAFGRSEQIFLQGRTLRLLLAKNPTGANENVRFVMSEESRLHVLILLNDRTADGRDPSWIWDVDYEPLLDRLDSLTLGGRRCWELALRFRYAGAPHDSFSVHERLPDALDDALSATPEGGTLWILPTYTAMLELRSELVRRGVAREFWETA